MKEVNILNIIDIISAARSRQYPSSWQVFHGEGSYEMVFFPLFFAAPLVYCSLSELFSQYFNIYALGIFGIPLVICLLITWAIIAAQESKKRSILVITHNGVVIGHRGKSISCLEFAFIKDLHLARHKEVRGGDTSIYTVTDYWLDVYGIDGKYHQTQIGSEFRNTATICKKIVAMHHHHHRK